MPLRVRCISCKRVLVLEDVFQNAHCRCAFCHTHQRVSVASKARPRPAARPAQPGLRLQRIAPVAQARSAGSNVSIDIADTVLVDAHRGLTRFHAAAGAFASFVVLLSVLAWQSGRPHPGAEDDGTNRILADATTTNDSPVITPVAPPAVTTPSAAMLLAASDADDFFGLPLSGGSVAIIADDRERLAPYAEQVALLSYAAGEFARSNHVGFGVVEARHASLSAAESENDPFYALPVARIQATMVRSEADVEADLAAAANIAQPWLSDKVFVVLAEPLDRDEQVRLATSLRKFRTPVNIIAIGEAAAEDYAALASITGGRFMPVTAEALGSLIARCDAQMPTRSK